MEITFVPKEGLAAGSLRARTHQEPRSGRTAARTIAVGIEAGFVPSDEPEPDYRGRESKRKKRTRPKTASRKRRGRRERTQPSRQRRRGERDGRRRRRRRRGGRGRSRDRDRGPERRRPAMHSASSRSGPTPKPVSRKRARCRRSRKAASPSRRNRRSRSARMAKRAPQAPPPPWPPRRPRPGRPAADRRHGAAPDRFRHEADRFGAVPDEIDTTPQRCPACAGCASAPVWSLKDDIPDTTPQTIDTTPRTTASRRKRAGGRGHLAASSSRPARSLALRAFAPRAGPLDLCDALRAQVAHGGSGRFAAMSAAAHCSLRRSATASACSARPADPPPRASAASHQICRCGGRSSRSAIAPTRSI